MRTLEEVLKFDSGLVIGDNLVTLVYVGIPKKAIVNIGKRGKVLILVEPGEHEIYSSVRQVKGNDTSTIHTTHVWAGKDDEIMQQFEGEPIATIDINFVKQFKKEC